MLRLCFNVLYLLLLSSRVCHMTGGLNSCQDIDPSACRAMTSQNPGMCSDPTLSKSVCPKFCNNCPLVCYSCNNTDAGISYCNTITCALGEDCSPIFQRHMVSGNGEEMTYQEGENKNNLFSIQCCDSDLCNIPTIHASITSQQHRTRESSIITTPVTSQPVTITTLSATSASITTITPETSPSVTTTTRSATSPSNTTTVTHTTSPSVVTTAPLTSPSVTTTTTPATSPLITTTPATSPSITTTRAEMPITSPPVTTSTMPATSPPVSTTTTPITSPSITATTTPSTSISVTTPTMPITSRSFTTPSVTTMHARSPFVATAATFTSSPVTTMPTSIPPKTTTTSPITSPSVLSSPIASLSVIATIPLTKNLTVSATSTSATSLLENSSKRSPASTASSVTSLPALATSTSITSLTKISSPLQPVTATSAAPTGSLEIASTKSIPSPFTSAVTMSMPPVSSVSSATDQSMIDVTTSQSDKTTQVTPPQTTTKQPTTAPCSMTTKHPGSCNKDVIFMAEIPSNPRELPKMQNLMFKLINPMKIGINSSRVALGTFSGYYGSTITELNRGINKLHVLQSIEYLADSPSDDASILSAVRYILDNFRSGNRPDIDDVIIILSQGHLVDHNSHDKYGTPEQMISIFHELYSNVYILAYDNEYTELSRSIAIDNCHYKYHNWTKNDTEIVTWLSRMICV